MDTSLLLDPNLAYLVLVAAGVLVFMSVITPGTGLFEIGALFALVWTGYAVYTSPINLWALLVLLLGVPPFLVAVRVSREWALLSLAIAIALFEVGSMFLFQSDAWWKPAVNPFLALVTVVLTSGFLWFATRKAIEAWRLPPHQNLAALVGQMGDAKTDVHDNGTVLVGGELWSATSMEKILVGSRVKVLGREGFTLVVKSVSASDAAGDQK